MAAEAEWKPDVKDMEKESWLDYVDEFDYATWEPWQHGDHRPLPPRLVHVPRRTHVVCSSYSDWRAHVREWQAEHQVSDTDLSFFDLEPEGTGYYEIFLQFLEYASGPLRDPEEGARLEAVRELFRQAGYYSREEEDAQLEARLTERAAEIRVEQLELERQARQHRVKKLEQLKGQKKRRFRLVQLARSEKSAARAGLRAIKRSRGGGALTLVEAACGEAVLEKVLGASQIRLAELLADLRKTEAKIETLEEELGPISERPCASPGPASPLSPTQSQ